MNREELVKKIEGVLNDHEENLSDGYVFYGGVIAVAAVAGQIAELILPTACSELVIRAEHVGEQPAAKQVSLAEALKAVEGEPGMPRTAIACMMLEELSTDELIEFCEKLVVKTKAGIRARLEQLTPEEILQEPAAKQVSLADVMKMLDNWQFVTCTRHDLIERLKRLEES